MTLKTLYVMAEDADVYGYKPNLPYQFPAEENPNASATESNFKCIVDIVMPIGGSESALFRYPKKGERVLVGIEDTIKKAFLMGYLPEEGNEKNKGQNDFFAGKDNERVRPGKMAGQFFRYKGSDDYNEKVDKKGNTIPQRETFSEIGFYTEETKWKRKGEETPPSIDTLKITSTGDIHQESANYSKIKAQRFELLSDCESDFGDHTGDDPFIYKGDVNIRAKNRVIIKAASAITFRVGRSSIEITDDGIIIRSRKVNSNIPSSWDSMINVDVHNGLKLSGQRIINQAGIEYIVWDGQGGTINSKLGVIRIAGIDIGLNKFTTKEFIEHGIISAVEFGANLAKTSAAFVDEQAFSFGKGVVDKINMVDGIFAAGFTAGHAMIPKLTGAASSYYHPAGFSSIMLSLLDLSKVVLMIVRIVVGMLIPEKLKRELPVINDSVYTAFAVVEFGLMNVAWVAMSVAWAPFMINESIIHMSDMDIWMESEKICRHSIFKEDTNSPVAGLNIDISEAWSKTKKALVGIFGIAAVGVVGGAVGSTLMLVTTPLNKALVEELMSL